MPMPASSFHAIEYNYSGGEFLLPESPVFSPNKHTERENSPCSDISDTPSFSSNTTGK
jgi:hypothetical protein